MRAHPISRSIGAAVSVAATAFLLAGCGGDSADAVGTTNTVATTTAPEPVTTTVTTTVTPPATTTTAGPKTITIVVKNAAPEGGIKRATVAKGDEVVLVVHSDVDDEVHLHGYNFSVDVPAGGDGHISFVASVPGQFEVELEQRGVQIANLTVTP